MGVITTEQICGGRLFGPIQRSLTLVDLGLLIGHMTCDDRPDVHKVRLDVNAYSEGRRLGEWVPYVQAARDEVEMNVEASVKEGETYYRITRTILPNQNLLVWYSPAYSTALDVPPLLAEYVKEDGRYVCPRCFQSFYYPNSLRAHMRFKCKYYTPQPCTDRQSPRAGADTPCGTTTDSYCRMLLVNNLTPPQISKGESRCSTSLFGFLSSPHRTAAPFDLTSYGGGTKRSQEDCNESDEKRLKTDVDDGEANEGKSSDDVTGRVFHQKENVDKVTSDRYDNVSAFRKVSEWPYQQRDHGFTDNAGVPRVAAFPTERMSPFERPPYAGAYVGLSNAYTMPMNGSPSPDGLHNNTHGQDVLANSAYVNMMNAYKAQAYPRLNISPYFSGKSIAQQNVNCGITQPQLMVPSQKTDQSVTPKRTTPGLEKALRGSYRPLVSSNYSTLNMMQNWCVKCNATFRMTTDLVYHMRSQHHREYDPDRRKRDDKLCCNVCGETFRERHHLSRHMTSHV